MRRVDAALVVIAILLAAVWYVLRVRPASLEPSAGGAPPASLARVPASPRASRPPGSGGDKRAAAGSPIEAGVGEAPGIPAVIDVVHKHKLGSCRGRLSVTATGLRYEPTRPGDGFDVPRASVERLEADPKKKVLTVKLRGGRTYNFTDARGRAEALTAFQQAFEKTRSRAGAMP
jgi:hypothetical protein